LDQENNIFVKCQGHFTRFCGFEIVHATSFLQKSCSKSDGDTEQMDKYQNHSVLAINNELCRVRIVCLSL